MWTIPVRHRFWLAIWSVVAITTLLAPLVASASKRDARVVAQPRLVWHKSFAVAQAEARRRGVPLLVHFHASWCGPCRRMERDVLDTRALAEKLGTTVVAVKVDTDREPAVTSRFRVRLLPTDLVATPDGKALVRTQGYQGLRSYVAKMVPTVTRYLATHPRKKIVSKKSESGARSNKKVPARSLKPRLGLAGFSPVTLWTQKRWQRGDKKFACRVGGEIYYMASARELEQFRGDPSHFAPRFGGDDVVHRLDTGRRVVGSIRHAVFYDGGLYLFGDATTLGRFLKSPTRFAITASRPAIGKR
ncbi:MAG: thioredoxin family protein [Planctomycetota bacterium]|nr:thioredoxin family protein [Planctomycetota bacterium]